MPVAQALYWSAAVTLLVVGTVLWIRALTGGGAQRWLDTPARLPAWTIGWGDFLLLPFFALVFLVFVSWALVTLVRPPATTPPAAEALLVAGYSMGLALIAAALLFRQLPNGHPGEGRERVSRCVGTGLLGLLYFLPVCTLLALGWNALTDALGLPAEVQDAVRVIRETHSPLMLAQWFLVVTVLAPVGEELIFRAGLFRFLSNRMRPGFAAAISAALFAAMHWNLQASLPLFVLGLTLAHVYHKSGRIVAAIVLHATFNLNTLLSIVSGAVAS